MYFPFKGIGYVKQVPGNWIIVTCDPEIVRYYTWLCKTWGIQIEAGSRNGPHISLIKSELPRYTNVSNILGKKVRFEYSNQLKTNDYHVWVDVRSTDMSSIRQMVGLPEKPFHSFHLTIGRLKLSIGHVSHEPRPKKKKNAKYIT